MVSFSNSAQHMRRSEIREIMKLANSPDLITFAGGMPNNELFPIKEIDEIYINLPLKTKQEGFQYGPTPGYPPLVESVKKYLKEKGFPVETNDLIITTGSLQAIYLVAKVFLNPGDRVVCEYPTFIGAIAAFNSFQGWMDSIPMDSDGILLQELENAFANQPAPKLLYLTPYFHNPAGIIYSHERKAAIIDFVQNRDVVLLEDNAYGELYFNEQARALTTPIKAMTGDCEKICYTGSFSKILGPGMRLGYLLAPPEILSKCELAKQSVDACSSTLTQVLAHEFMAQNKLMPYLQRVRPIYARRLKLMLDALEKKMPEEVTWTKPSGGFYVWVQLPERVDAIKVLKEAIQQGAVFVIGQTFDPDARRNNCFRLAFSHVQEDKIEQGIQIIAEALKKVLR
jgi:2-aminoadipate transaminase